MNASTSCKEHAHHHGKSGSQGPPPTGGGKGMAKDPICGMVVPRATALSTQRGRRDYYFCSQSCLQTFQNPDRELRVMRRRVGFVIGGVLALALFRAGAFIALGAAGFTAVLPARFPAVYLRMAHSGQVLSQTEA